MWEDEGRKRKIINIILAALTVLLLAVMVYCFFIVRDKNAREDQQLQQIYIQHQAEQTEAKKVSYDSVETEYKKDLAAVEEYMPGIVCWGDALTTGSYGNVSFPGVLEELIEENICSKYDLRSTLDNADDITRISASDWLKYEIEIPVYNMGGGQETVGTVMGRQGSTDFKIKESFKIPADCSEVKISMSTSEGASVNPLKLNDNGFNNVVIEGIEGKIAYTKDKWGYSCYTFTRLEPGEETKVEAGTEFSAASAGLYADCIPVFWVGTYGGYSSANDLVRKIQQMVDYSGSERYIVLGLFTSSESTGLDSIEIAMQTAFGESYINIRKYLATDALSDLGLSPTSDDSKAMKNGKVPPTLLNPSDSSELSSNGYKIVAKVVYDRMESLGYFNEINEECEIKPEKN